MYVKNTFNSFLYRKADTAVGGGGDEENLRNPFYLVFILVLLQGV